MRSTQSVNPEHKLHTDTDMPKTKTKKQRPSGVKVTMTRTGLCLQSYGPSAPDLRTVLPELLGARPPECGTCRGNGRIRDGETGALRRCLDCGGTGSVP